jgi:acyl-CoA synthetase (AMP-forming)/AMP-acid ligase II
MAEATLAITFTELGQGLRTDTVDGAALAEGAAVRSEPSDASSEIVDCGRAFPGHDLAIVDAASRRLADRQVGQIVARGPSIATGYFREPELTAQTYKAIDGDAPGDGPWLHTGDLGYTVGDHLFVCGRVKDIIIIRGRNYYPSDIEWAVSEASNLRRGNVVAFGISVDSAGRASTGAAGEEQLVVCCEGHSAEAEAIRGFATGVIASRFGLTVHEVVVAPFASLPRTSSGKPKRRETKQKYLDGSLSRARTVQSVQGGSAHSDDQGPGAAG